MLRAALLAMTLLVPEHPTTHPARRAEIADCLFINLAHPAISRVIVWRESLGPSPLPRHRKLAEWMDGGRPTFARLFAAAAAFPGPAVIANADIFFDATLALAHAIAPGDFYALSRWNPAIQAIDGTQAGGDIVQHIGADAWIFRAPLPPLPAHFPQGTPYCDHRLARLALDAGLRVSNPCRSISAWHHHASQHRTYTAAQRVPGPCAWLPPVALTVPNP